MSNQRTVLHCCTVQLLLLEKFEVREMQYFRECCTDFRISVASSRNTNIPTFGLELWNGREALYM